MAVSRLLIENFRNITQADLDFHPSFNFVVGNNGSGKTSLLEALFFLAHGRSFKSALSNRIITHNAPHFTLHGRVNEEKLQWSVGLQKPRQGSTLIKINGEEGNKIADLAHLLPMQIITPEGLSLVSGGPKYRRAFLDWGLFHHQSSFHQVWKNMRRLLKQRNAALVHANSPQEMLIWDKALAESANQVTYLRQAYAKTLSKPIQATCDLFLPEVEIELSFYTGWEQDADYLTLLQENFWRDKKLGFTVSGPQKADLKFKSSGIPVEDVLSRGQLKLLMCALRLAQGEHLMAQKNRHCIFLIDDFASELDIYKRSLLAKRLKQSGSQVFVSAIHREQLEPMQTQSSKVFHLEKGQFQFT